MKASPMPLDSGIRKNAMAVAKIFGTLANVNTAQKDPSQKELDKKS
jgi:hypothetical protein